MQDVVFIDHENLVGMIGQALEAAQVTQHHFTSNVGADADQLEVHNRTDLVVFIRHRRLDLGALFLVARLQGFIDHLVRQIARQLRQFVRVQVIDRRQQLVFVHRLDQRFTHRVGHFQQHFTVVFRRDQQPDNITFARRQRFQHRRHVGRVQLVQKDGQLGKFVAQRLVLNRHAFFNLREGGRKNFAQRVDTVEIGGNALYVAFDTVVFKVRRGLFDAHKCSARRMRESISAGWLSCISG